MGSPGDTLPLALAPAVRAGVCGEGSHMLGAESASFCGLLGGRGTHGFS